eukprot:COSAG01_NODE_7485_length_3190_cov_2.884180_1_plen_56_part_10
MFCPVSRCLQQQQTGTGTRVFYSSQSAPDRRFGKFRCTPRRIGLAGGDGRTPNRGV